MHIHFLLYTQEPVFTNRAHIFMRWCLPWFSEFLCYIKAREGPTARQHSILTSSLWTREKAYNLTVKESFRKYTTSKKFRQCPVLKSSGLLWVKWKVRRFLQFVLEQWTKGCRFQFYWNLWICHFFSVCVCALTRWYAYSMCVCICWRIREWDPRIHSLECEVCVLSNPRARNVS